MKTYLAREYRPEPYAVRFPARDMRSAAAVCDVEGWALDGEHVATLQGIGDDRANELLAALSESEGAVRQ